MTVFEKDNLVMVWVIFVFIVVVSVAGGIMIASERPSTEPIELQPHQIYIDPMNGCHYVKVRYAITPRLHEGEPYCGPRTDL